MYFMVVVVAAVNAVDNVSLTKSEPIPGAPTDVQITKSHGEDFGMSCLEIVLVP